MKTSPNNPAGHRVPDSFEVAETDTTWPPEWSKQKRKLPPPRQPKKPKPRPERSLDPLIILAVVVLLAIIVGVALWSFLAATHFVNWSNWIRDKYGA